MFVALTGCATKPIVPVTVSGKTVVFQGLISDSVADEFIHAVEQHDANRVLIASGSGHVAPALRMAGVVHQRGMDVEVFGLCFSSCANYIFPAWKNKSIASLGTVGWHGNIQHLLYLHRNGEVPIQGARLDEATTLAAQETEFYTTIGVDSFVTWFGKLAPYSVPPTPISLHRVIWLSLDWATLRFAQTLPRPTCLRTTRQVSKKCASCKSNGIRCAGRLNEKWMIECAVRRVSVSPTS